MRRAGDAETFTFKTNDGNSLSDIARLDTMVTVVDGFNFLRDYAIGLRNREKASIDTLKDLNMGANDNDLRTVVHLMTDQIEFANFEPRA